MSKKTNLLEVRDLSIHYSGNTILKDVSLDVRKNEIFGIIGPSGSGKTSFLKAVNRMDELTSGMSTTGSIRFQGYDTSAWKNLFSLRFHPKACKNLCFSYVFHLSGAKKSSTCNF